MTATPLTKNKVLIIEDESDLCLLLEIMLNDGKTTIDHAKNLKTAREFLDREKPQLVVLDNRLPDGLGLDFLPYIRENFPQTRVIMISGKDGSSRDLAIENGAHIFLSKPFTREKLYNSVHALLN
ncbi:MAG: response regulator [Bacteroidota bacterium]